jgi:hypothetical protein
MANKYHRQGFKVGKIVKAIENIYKKDKTGKKDKIIEQLNKATEKQRKKFTKGDKITEEPKGLDFYTNVMASDFEKKTGPYFDRLKKKTKKKKND